MTDQHHTLNNSKPLYQYESNLAYQKHKQRLQVIKHRAVTRERDSLKEMHKIWEKPMKERIKRNKKIELQNEKLLDKLVGIATRSVTIERTKSIKGDNHYRRNIKKNIKRENEDFGERLINLQSDLEYNKIRKSMQKYDKVKQLIHKNKRCKLPTLPYSKHKGSESLIELYYDKGKVKTKGEEVESQKTVKTKNINTLETITVEF